MFDPKKLTDQFRNMSEGYWMMTTQMLLNFREQNEKMLDTLLAQGLVAQQQGQKMFEEWLERVKNARQQFDQQIDANWKKMEAVFGLKEQEEDKFKGKK